MKTDCSTDVNPSSKCLRGLHDLLANSGAHLYFNTQPLINRIVCLSHGYPLPISLYVLRILLISRSRVTLAMIEAEDTAVFNLSAWCIQYNFGGVGIWLVIIYCP